MSIACILVAGSLWMTGGDGGDVIRVNRVAKEPDTLAVTVWDANNYRYEYRAEGSQYTMNSEEFFVDCVERGYEVIQ